MSIYGEVTLKFGPRGEEGEPLRFQVGHINLIVGPNNAGKSLMLRELSGVNPRARKPRYGKEPELPEPRIVASVDWSEEVQRTLREDLLRQLFEDTDGPFAEMAHTSWEPLVAALDRVPTQLTTIRDDLAMAIVSMTPEHVREGLKAQLPFPIGEVAPKDLSTMMIVGGLLILLFSREAERRESETITVDPNGEPQSSDTKPGPLLSTEQMTALEELLTAAWGRALVEFECLGINREGLHLDDLLHAHVLGGFILDKINVVPIFRSLLQRLPDFPSWTVEDEAVRGRLARLEVLTNWLFDPTPLVKVHGALLESYSELTWSNPEQRQHLAPMHLYLDGLTRLQMTRTAQLTPMDEEDEDAPPILRVFKDRESRTLLRELVEEMLGEHLVVDVATSTPQMIWRLSKEEPAEDLEEKMTKETAAYMRQAVPLEERSDGIHALVGMLAALAPREHSTVFIDEPEAFLHPPLVRHFARILAQLASHLSMQIFVATHSAELLAACATQGTAVNIIRLTHDDDSSTARLLDGATLRELALDPLLRSESLLSALFHAGAVVCEAAADRVLYQEINERLLLYDEEGAGMDSVVFLNAQNWQTIPRMVKPLREMGVAAAAIVDSDVLSESHLKQVLVAALMPEELCRSVLQLRADLRAKMAKRLGVNEKKITFKFDQVATMSSSERKLFEKVCRELAEYGVFLVPVGELEDWLQPEGLRRSRDKYKWLRKALDRLGLDPVHEDYVRPKTGDIWDFMRSVADWIEDPEREGTTPVSLGE